jgi:hypothetical protein
MLSEPAASLTDLALGLVTLALYVRMRGEHGPSARYWRLAFAWTAAAALAGAVHHGVVTYWHRPAEISWAIISGGVVIAISYVLAATVVEVLGPGRWGAFWALRSASLLAYAVVAVTGHAGIGAILSCEGITMACVLALWGLALSRGHPRSRGVVLALVASMAAAGIRAAPIGHLPLTFDSTALYHLAQIPGLVLLYVAVAGPARVSERLVRARTGGATA